MKPKNEDDKAKAQTQVYTTEKEREEFRINCKADKVSPSVKGRQLIGAYNESKKVKDNG